MRTAQELQDFEESIRESTTDESAIRYYLLCYEANIPKSFWDVSSAKVVHNTSVFKKVVLNFCKKRRKAQRHGWSLMFMGDNGVGKTMFSCYVLTQMIKRHCSVYYTTLAELDEDLKRGFKDREAEAGMRNCLSREFLVIDELGKEHFRNDSWLMTQLERILKRRCDDNDPTVICTNIDYERLSEMYGPSITSIWDGKYALVPMAPGDFRKSGRVRMKKEMGI